MRRHGGTNCLFCSRGEALIKEIPTRLAFSLFCDRVALSRLDAGLEMKDLRLGAFRLIDADLLCRLNLEERVSSPGERREPCLEVCGGAAEVPVSVVLGGTQW